MRMLSEGSTQQALPGRGPSRVVLIAALAMVALIPPVPAALPAGARELAQGGTGPALRDAAETIVKRLSFRRFRRNVQTLAGFETRYWNSDGNELARDWIQERLESWGYEVERHRFVASGRNGEEPAKEVDSVYATKMGSTRPGAMYIASAHMDSTNFDSPDRSFAPGANDDASGTSLVLELARVFAGADVETDVSIRFVLWNAEEIGLVGSRAYVEDRRALRGVESPEGSGLYPEPEWLGVIQHDMLLFDHGLPPGPSQSLEADVDIEYDADAASGGDAVVLAAKLLGANGRYAQRYPAEVGQFMQSTDSVPFAPYVAAVSVRENERRNEIGNGTNPQWHRSTDTYATYRTEDFRLGYAALQTSAGALAELAGAVISR